MTIQLISPNQCRAARAYLDWSQADLAHASTVSLRAIQDFEKEKRLPNAPTIMALKYALELQGLIFTYEPEGCYLRKAIEKLAGIGPDPEKMGWGHEIERDVSSQNYFTPNTQKQLTDEYSRLNHKYDELLIRYTSIRFNNQEAYEYTHHGFMRRMGILKRCVHNIYKIYSPHRSDKPSNEERKDIEINLQSFVFNVFGCIDNLAWIWTKEKNIQKNGKALPSSQVGLMSSDKNEIIRKSLSPEFCVYLDSRREWYEALEDFRHALAHRIPLYVPPYSITPDEVKEYEKLEKLKADAIKNHAFETYEELDAQQDELGRFIPCMKHSETNSRPIVFHAQVLADWNTMVEMSEKFLDELRLNS